MKCKVCGGEILENSKFCTNCGAKVEENIGSDSIPNMDNSQSVVDNNQINSELKQNENVISNTSNFGNSQNSNEVSNENILNDTNGHNVNYINTTQYSGNINNDVNNNMMQYNENINNNVNNTPILEEKSSVGLAILSFIIPLVGLIIFLVNKNNKPKTAKTCGICALVSFLFGIVFSVIFVIFIPTLIVSDIIDKTEQQVEQLEEEEQIDEDNYFNNVFTNAIEENDNVVTNESDINNSVVVSNDWKKYEITVNGKTLTLPMTYNDLTSNTGFSFKSDAMKSYIGKNKYALVNMYKNDKLALYTEVLNDGEEDKLYTDCKITRVWQTKYQFEQGADVISFPGGLKVGESVSEDKIIEMFGQPTKIGDYSSDGYVSKTYTYNEDTTWTTVKYYEIKIVNGVIDELLLDNRR